MLKNLWLLAEKNGELFPGSSSPNPQGFQETIPPFFRVKMLAVYGDGMKRIRIYQEAR
jgi:hypothetical protein